MAEPLSSPHPNRQASAPPRRQPTVTAVKPTQPAPKLAQHGLKGTP